MKLQGYTPRVAYKKASVVAELLEIDQRCRMLPANNDWVSQHSNKPHVIRMPKQLWDSPFALAWDEGIMWQLVPVWNKGTEHNANYHLWIAVDRDTPKNVAWRDSEDDTVVFCKDWKYTKRTWINPSLILDLDDDGWDYDNLPGVIED